MGMKKRLIALGAVVLLGVCMLAGCSPDKDNGQNQAQQESPAAPAVEQQEAPAEPTAIVYEDDATVQIQPQDGQAATEPDAVDDTE